MAERLRLIEELPDDGLRDDPQAPRAASLLRGPVQVLAAVEAATLAAEAAGMRRMDWDELTAAACLASDARAAEPLCRAVSGRPPGPGAPRAGRSPAPPSPASLGGVLDAIDAGLLWTKVADLLPGPSADRLTGRARREALRPGVRAGLAGLVRAELVRSGRARWELSWSHTALLVTPDGLPERLEAALDAAVADTPDTAALRGVLDGPWPPVAGTSADLPPAAGPAPDRVPASATARVPAEAAEAAAAAPGPPVGPSAEPAQPEPAAEPGPARPDPVPLSQGTGSPPSIDRAQEGPAS